MQIYLGCSGWSYSDPPEKGGWTKVFYPSSQTKRLSYYSRFFDTVEMDSTFYEKFYKYMTKQTFIGMDNATPENFEFSIKVPETVTHIKRLDVEKGSISSLEEFLDKISPLKIANKLGAILVQLPPSFTVSDFKDTENFLDRLPSGYQYALEFRHPSWNTEGPWEMLKHYDIAAVMTDSPLSDNLQYLAEVTITSKNHSFIRFHGRSSRHRYNYLYSKEELKHWIGKIKEIASKTNTLRIYFNNHYGAKAVINALEFKDMLGISLSNREKNALEFAKSYYSRTTLDDIIKDQ
ncbi:MAG TPA: DUF72 domain-containing protein [Nitrososphaeraceae archaeon]|nr:DUF72 domain-containing protein [Nitrososphaeraceae archaeon]